MKSPPYCPVDYNYEDSHDGSPPDYNPSNSPQNDGTSPLPPPIHDVSPAPEKGDGAPLPELPPIHGESPAPEKGDTIPVEDILTPDNASDPEVEDIEMTVKKVFKMKLLTTEY